MLVRASRVGQETPDCAVFVLLEATVAIMQPEKATQSLYELSARALAYNIFFITSRTILRSCARFAQLTASVAPPP